MQLDNGYKREYILGVDIGGTKSSIACGTKDNTELQILDYKQFPTATVDRTLPFIITSIEQMMQKHRISKDVVAAIGISCGGPLDASRGVIMSPPNLPGWDNIPIVDKLYSHFGIVTGVQNDADACTLAEWNYGAGRGTRNMAFMTFGTGLGAGFIFDGKLYNGANGNAGELGHVRLSDYGPVGYGKAGSFEGFCSGNGISQIAHMMITEKMQMGELIGWCKPEEVNALTARKIAGEAFKGDELALKIFDISAKKLGEGVSIIIDILNPEVIVIGGIYTRCWKLMEAPMMETIRREALPNATKVCRVLPSALGEQIGIYSALSVAADLSKKIK